MQSGAMSNGLRMNDPPVELDQSERSDGLTVEPQFGRVHVGGGWHGFGWPVE